MRRMLLAAVMLCFGLSLAGQSAAQACDPKDPKCCDPKKEVCGTPCSPGYYKNHVEFWWGIYCDTEQYSASCTELLNALVCRGNDAACGRSAAAGYLNELSGCTE